MAQILSIARARERLELRGPTGQRVLDQATVSTLGLREAARHWWQIGMRPSYELMVSTVTEPSTGCNGFAELAKIGRFTYKHGKEGVVNECVLVKHEPNVTVDALLSFAPFGYELVEGMAGDVYVTGVVNPRCAAVTLLRTWNSGRNWKAYDATPALRDFYVGPDGQVAVISGVYAALVDHEVLLRAIFARSLVIATGVEVGPNDLLTRIRRPLGGEFADLARLRDRHPGREVEIAIFHPEKRETCIYRHGRMVERARTMNFILTALTENRAEVISLARGTPRSGATRVITGSADLGSLFEETDDNGDHVSSPRSQAK